MRIVFALFHQLFIDEYIWSFSVLYMFNDMFGLFCWNCVGSVKEKSYPDLYLFRFDILYVLFGMS